nr:hypothetical protein [Tanacetum cinerariifolium]
MNGLYSVGIISLMPFIVYLAAGVLVMEEEYYLSELPAFKVCPVELICQSTIAFPHILFQFDTALAGKDIKEKDKIVAKTEQNQAGNGKRGKVNQVKAKVKVKPIKTGHEFGKSMKTKAEGVNILLV